MFYFRVTAVIFRHGHDGRDAGFIVAAQQCRAVGQDKVLVQIILQIRKVADFHDDVLFLIQNDVTSVIVLQKPWLHVGSGSVRGRIHVGDKADFQTFVIQIGRQDAVDNTLVFIEPDIADTDFFHFFFQNTGKVKLFGGGRNTADTVCRLGIDFRIAHQTFENTLIEFTHNCFFSYWWKL